MSMQSRLGLQQPPASTPARKRAQPKALPKREGPLWATVTIVKEHPTSPSLQCNNCGHAFCGGATRIRGWVVAGVWWLRIFNDTG